MPQQIAPMVTWGTSPEDALPDHRRASPIRRRRPMPPARWHAARRSTTWA